MSEELRMEIRPGSALDDPDYPYLLFVRDHGWKYDEEAECIAAYLRRVAVRHGKILTEDEFMAEAGTKYAEAASKLYPKLSRMVRAGMLTPGRMFGYAQHLWCMNDSHALLAVQTAKGKWEVNSCDSTIPAEKAKNIICREWGFDPDRVKIQEAAYYESTDWNFIRFQCGPLNWVMHDDSLYMVYD